MGQAQFYIIGARCDYKSNCPWPDIRWGRPDLLCAYTSSVITAWGNLFDWALGKVPIDVLGNMNFAIKFWKLVYTVAVQGEEKESWWCFMYKVGIKWRTGTFTYILYGIYTLTHTKDWVISAGRVLWTISWNETVSVASLDSAPRRQESVQVYNTLPICTLSAPVSEKL